MILGVKIQNRITKEYMTKGGGWNKIGKVWSRLSDAKKAICPFDYRYWENTILLKGLSSDFIIINEEGIIEKMPVAIYFIEYFQRELKRTNRKELVQQYLNQIKQYCKVNNIETETTNGK